MFELENEDRDPVDEKEANLHEVMWKKRDEFDAFFSVVEGQFVKSLIDGADYIFTGDGVLAGQAQQRPLLRGEQRQQRRVQRAEDGHVSEGQARAHQERARQQAGVQGLQHLGIAGEGPRREVGGAAGHPLIDLRTQLHSVGVGGRGGERASDSQRQRRRGRGQETGWRGSELGTRRQPGREGGDGGS